MTPALLALLIYVAVALLVAAALLLVRDLRAAGRRPAEPAPAEPLDIRSLLPPTEAAAAETRDRSWLGRLVAETGYDLTSDIALLLAILVGLALGGALFVWRDDWLAAAAGAMLGFLLVGGVLYYLRTRRRRILAEQLPDVMELMARAVRAGESLDQAIALAGDSTLRPLAGEFRWCASQMKIGLSLETAMRRLVRRVPLLESRILAMTLAVQRQRGGNLPGTLERLARVFRDRSNLARQFRAATALGRGSTVLIALIALGLDALVVVGHTEYTASLLTSYAGRIMLVAALLLQLLGIAWLLWLFRSE
jgi:tight adherence protein B